jgi:hypothetical protein
VDRQRGASFSLSGLLHGQRYLGLLRQLVELHVNLIPPAPRLDVHAAHSVTTHHIRRGPDTLECIAQLAPARADVVRFIADAHQIVETALKRRLGHARAIVVHKESMLIESHGDLWRDPRRLTGIKGIIEQLFREGNWPVPPWKTDLHLQLALGEELQGAAHLKSGPGQGGLSHASSSY